MKVRILDAAPLHEVSPKGLAAYARSVGWAKAEPYGGTADVWLAEGLPEIVLPRTNRLGDYAAVVSRLIGIFSRVGDKDEFATLRDLLETDHDVIRVGAMEGTHSGSIGLDEGVKMVSQARQMLLAAACATVASPQRVYRAGANKQAAGFLKRVQLGQTEHGSFVVTLTAPVRQTVHPEFDAYQEKAEPLSRRVNRRLVEALKASKDAAERWNSGTGHQEFDQAVWVGVSANLCDAVAGLIEHTKHLEVSVAWALMGPPRPPPARIRFSPIHQTALREAAKNFRADATRTDSHMVGSVHRLMRDRRESGGSVTLKAEIDGKTQSVAALLDETNYRVAIRAHDARRRVIVQGDLERIGQRWHVKNADVRELRD